MSVASVLERQPNVRDMELICRSENSFFHPEEISQAFWERLRLELELESKENFPGAFNKAIGAVLLLGRSDLIAQEQKEKLLASRGEFRLAYKRLIDPDIQFSETDLNGIVNNERKDDQSILRRAEGAGVLGEKYNFTQEEEEVVKQNWASRKPKLARDSWYFSLMKRVGIDPEVSQEYLNILRDKIFDFDLEMTGDPRSRFERHTLTNVQYILDLYILSSDYAGFENGKLVVKNLPALTEVSTVPEPRRFDV